MKTDIQIAQEAQMALSLIHICCTLRCSVSRPIFRRNAFCGAWMEPKSRISWEVAFVMYAPLPNFFVYTIP